MYEHKIKSGIIHCHTHYSVKDSAMSVDELLGRAVELEAPAVVLTDHGVLSGTYPLFAAAKKVKEQGKEIKVIPGVEAYVKSENSHTKNMHLLLIPCNYTGYKAICKAVTLSNKDIDSVSGAPRMSKDILVSCFGEGSEGHGNVIASSACIAGVLGQILNQNTRVYKEIKSVESKLASSEKVSEEDAKTVLERLDKIEKSLNDLNTRKKELAAIIKKPETKLMKTVESLKGKEGYSAALKSLNELRKSKEDALAESETIKERITALTKEKKGLGDTKAKIKSSQLAREKYEPILDELRNGIKSYQKCVDETEEAASMYENLFGKGNFYIELQYHGYANEETVMSELAKIANRLDIPTVATNDAHVARNTEDDFLARRINVSQRFKVWQEEQEGDRELYIKADDELYKTITKIVSKEDADKAMTGIGTIVDRCNVVFPDETHYPKFVTPDGSTSGEYLRKLAEAGIKKRYGDKWNEEYQKRLDYELEIIHKMGFDDYHLVVQDYLNYARNLAKGETGIGVGVGPGRGSAVGSIVCYLIGITDVDPIRHDLLFERYLNPERVSMPDIDCDFANYLRPSIIEYVKSKYGENGICMIETDSMQPPKASIKAIGRLRKEYQSKAEAISSNIPAKYNKHFSTKTDDGKTLKESLLSKFNDPESKEVIRLAGLIEGSMINYGTHAAGVVIGDCDDLSNYIPLRMNNGMWTCQCTKEEVEACAGLLKFDFLGLKNLDIENMCVNLVYKNHGVKIDLSNIPFEKAVFKNIFAEGKTNGIFQFESAGMKKMLKEFKPDCIEDIILLVAAYRPGPLQYIPEIKAVKHREKRAEYIFPELESVLGATYGKPVYQEQIQAIFHRFAGFSLGQADIIRRIMSKKKMELLTDPKTRYKERFIEGMVSHGATNEQAEKFWIELLEFANYAFNKSHAAAYAYLAYQTAYLKYHYPSEYIASVLYMAEPDKYPLLINEAHSFNVNVVPPSLRYSNVDFDANYGEIIFGFNNIKGIGSLGETIVEERKHRDFSSLKDFLKRVPVNQGHLSALIQAGVFDEFNENRASLLSGSEAICDVLEQIKKKKEALNSAILLRSDETLSEKKRENNEKKIITLQQNICDFEDIIETYCFSDVMEDRVQKLEKERELLGYCLSGHPMDSWKIPDDAIDIADITDGNNIIAGVIRDFVVYNRKSDGAEFAKFTLEDKSGNIEVICWASRYNGKLCDIIRDGVAIKAVGKCIAKESETEDGEINITYSFALNEALELERKLEIQEIAQDLIDSHFEDRLTAVIPNISVWLKVMDEFKKFKDEFGVPVIVKIKGYRKSNLSYRVSKDILNSNLKEMFV